MRRIVDRWVAAHCGGRGWQGEGAMTHEALVTSCMLGTSLRPVSVGMLPGEIRAALGGGESKSPRGPAISALQKQSCFRRFIRLRRVRREVRRLRLAYCVPSRIFYESNLQLFYFNDYELLVNKNVCLKK